MTSQIIKDIANAVGAIAPSIATALLGPAGGVAVTLLENLFGVKSDGLVASISSDPSSALKLKELEDQHGEVLIQLTNSDKANARDRDVQIIKSGKSDWVLSTIAIMVVIGFFILCVLNYFEDLKDDHVLIMLIGQMSSGFVMVLSFYFGSSQSQNK